MTHDFQGQLWPKKEPIESNMGFSNVDWTATEKRMLTGHFPLSGWAKLDPDLCFLENNGQKEMKEVTSSVNGRPMKYGSIIF